MIPSIEIIINVIELGLIYSLIVLAVHISSTIIALDDLTIEGSFATGGALTAILISQAMPSWLAIVGTTFIGALIGIMTGLLHTQLKLNNLISGIVVTTALFSINLKLAGATITLPQQATILDTFAISWLTPWSHLIILLIISSTMIGTVAWLLTTEVGFLLKAVGGNQNMLTILGKRITLYKLIGLALANSLTALAGALLILHIGFFSITGNIGTLAAALAGLIIGQVLCNHPLIGAIIGSIGYQAIIATTIECHLDPAWNKLITALLIVLLISVRNQLSAIKTKG